MTAYSCTVGVDSVSGEDFGAAANLSYRPGGGIDIAPGPFGCQITEDAAGIVTPGAELVMTLASKDDVTVDSIGHWLFVNKASMSVVSSDLGADPTLIFEVTLRRPGKPDLVGKAGGSVGLAFGVAIGLSQ
jgi:hypothetical protein